MSKYVIVTRKDYISDGIEAVNADEALIAFAANMDTDMNLYFMAVPEEKANINSDSEIAKRNIIEFMKDELWKNFGFKADPYNYCLGLTEGDAETVAEAAYEIYCNGDGQTQYECIEQAFYDFCKVNDYDADALRQS